jgi:hypothetical protein
MRALHAVAGKATAAAGTTRLGIPARKTRHTAGLVWGAPSGGCGADEFLRTHREGSAKTSS